MSANSNALRQNAQGRWDLTLRHDQPNVDLEIPVKLTYRGTQVSMTVKNTDQTINTGWYTELGVPIDTNDIIKYAQPVIKGGKTYIVPRDGWHFTVEPYTVYSVEIEPRTASISANGHISLEAYYIGRQGGSEVSRIAVTSLATWSGNNSYVIVNGGSVSGNNASTSTTQSSVVSASYSGETGYCNITVDKASGSGETTYELSVSATPSSISWSGSSWLTAEYVTLVDGQPTSRVPVSPGSISWEITKNPGYGTINSTTGEFVANNQSLSGTNREIKIRGTYSGLTSNEVAIQVSKRPAGETTYRLEVVPKTGAIGSADTVDLQAWFYIYEAGSLEPTETLNVTEFADCIWVSDKYDVATVSAGHVVSDNQTYAEQDVVITASYCGCTDFAAIKVAPKEGQAPEYYYALVVVPTAVTLEYSGITQLQAEFRTYEGTDPNPVATEVVTTGCQWSTDNQLVFVDNDLNKGLIESKVYDSAGTEAVISAVYQRSYSSFTGTAHITVNGKFIDFVIDTTPFVFECPEQTSVTRQITTTDDITWHVSLVSVAPIGADIDWVTVSPENGSGSGVITLTVAEENSGSTVRECFALVHYPADSPDYKQIVVSQYPTPRFSVANQSVTAPQIGSTERVLINTNYNVSADTNENWMSLDISRADNGFYLEITTTETSAERSGVVSAISLYDGSCAAFEPIPIMVNQEYTPPVPPEPTGYVYFYATETAETPSRPLEIIKSAAEADVEFWISSSIDTKITGISGEGFTIRETNGLDLTTGATISATGLDYRRKLIAHIPKNTLIGSENDRTFIARFKTSYQQSSNDVVLVILQHGNHFYDEPVIKFFEFDDQGLGQDEVTINSGQIFIKPYVYIESTRHFDSGDIEVARLSDYAVNGVVDDNKIGIGVVASDSTAIIISNDIGHGGTYNASPDFPFELYVPSNQGLAATGETRDIVLTLTYKGATPWLTRTFTIHQLYSQKQLDPVDMSILSGSSHLPVDVLSATPAYNAQIIGEEGTGYVRIQGETGVTIVVSGEYSKFALGGGMNIGEEYYLGSDNGKDLSLTNLGTSGQHYQIKITCSKDGTLPKDLIIDVTVQ